MRISQCTALQIIRHDLQMCKTAAWLVQHHLNEVQATMDAPWDMSYQSEKILSQVKSGKWSIKGVNVWQARTQMRGLRLVLSTVTTKIHIMVKSVNHAADDPFGIRCPRCFCMCHPCSTGSNYKCTSHFLHYHPLCTQGKG